MVKFNIYYICFLTHILCYSQHDTVEKNLLQTNQVLEIIKEFHQSKQYDSALFYAEKLKPLALKNKDTVILQKSLFRIAYYNSKLSQPVMALSAFQESLDLALARKDTMQATKLYNNISILQYRLTDYHACQNTIVKSLSLLKNTEHKYQNQKFTAYNALANSYKAQKNFKKAIETFNDAEKFSSDSRSEIALKNNLALVYFEENKFQKAIDIYETQLQHDSINKYTNLKARLLDNLGFAQFSLQSNKGLDNMLSAKEIREAVKDNIGLFASYLHLSKYFLNKDANQSFDYASKAYDIALGVKSYESQIEALELLIKSKSLSEHINRYLILNDSLKQAELLEQNKYAGLKFETEETENQNLQLKAENAQQALLTQKANIQKWGFAIGLIIVGILAFLIWRRYRAEARAKQTITEQNQLIETLQKDLHHRVKNNLSIIDAFVDEIKDDLKDEKLLAKLTELQNRISSINEVHSQLYKSTDITNVEVKRYVNSIAKNVASTFNKPDIEIEERISDDLRLDPTKSSLLGLIINEFITNSFKHAFEETGKIIIEIKEENEFLEIKLSDNGKGLPADFNIDTISSYGFRIMKLLSKQLEGTFNFKNNQGLILHIEFPKNQLT